MRIDEIALLAVNGARRAAEVKEVAGVGLGGWDSFDQDVYDYMVRGLATVDPGEQCDSAKT